LVDKTVSATSYAIKDIVKEEADDYFVVVLSDANIQQYSINPEDIAKGNLHIQGVINILSYT